MKKTQKRLNQDKRSANWLSRLEIFRLRNQGWTFAQIGEKMGVTRQRICSQYHRVKDMDVRELELLVKKQEENSL